MPEEPPVYWHRESDWGQSCEVVPKNYYDALRAYALSLREREGMVMVPREPTRKMCVEGKNAMPVEYRYWQEHGMLHSMILSDSDCVQPESVYKAMLAAAPPAGEGKK